MLYDEIDTFTVSLRFYLDETEVDEDYYLMGDAVRSTGDDGFYVEIDNASGLDIFNITAWIQHSDNTRSYATTGAGGACQSVIAGDTWYHIVMIFYYYTANIVHWILYLDETYCANTGADSIINKSFVQDGSSVYIGNEKTADQGFREGNRIDDLMFFDGDLRDNEDAWDQLMDDPTTMPTGEGQGGTPPGGQPETFSDDFEAYSGDTPCSLSSQSDWTNIAGALEIVTYGSDEHVNPNSSSTKSSCYYNTAIDADQYSQWTMDQVGGVHAGPIVRASSSADTYYYYEGNTFQSYLGRRVAGSDTDLATGDPWSSGDIVRIEVEGDVLRVYKNGSLDTSIDTDGIYTDDGPSKLTSGYSGGCAYGNTGSVDMDDYEGGEL